MLIIVDQLAPLLIEDSQRTTEPVWPLKVILPALVPLQTVAADAVLPPTEVGSTSITLASFIVEEHPVVLFVIVTNVNVEVDGKTVAVVVTEYVPDPLPLVLSEVPPEELGALTV